MSTEFTQPVHQETRRQVEICNACRYCEGYCSVFPSIFSQRAFSDGDLTQYANLCHNCRGCYYACQYAEPHEFAINLPGILAELRQKSWQDHAWPGGLARLFEKSGVAMAALLVIGSALFLWLAASLQPASGEGFYSVLSHTLMISIFLPAFLFPLFAIAISVRRYWRTVGGGKVSVKQLLAACKAAADMRNLKGGHGDGCNFEDEDRFTNARRIFHQKTLWGFLLCFAATSCATLYHYAFGWQAPYELFSLPKLLGLSGGVILCLGTAGLAWLKTKADPKLGVPSVWGGEMAFIVLLFGVSLTGLLLYAATGSSWVSVLLPIHLGFVLTFFLMMPYSKMVHGFYRMAALIRAA